MPVEQRRGLQGALFTKTERALERLDDGYRRVLHIALHHRAHVFAGGFAAVVVAILMIQTIGVTIGSISEIGRQHDRRARVRRNRVGRVVARKPTLVTSPRETTMSSPRRLRFALVRFVPAFGLLILTMSIAAPAAAQPPAPPGSAPWQASADIGAVGMAGSTTLLGEGAYAVRGAGHDIWGTADAFHYLFTDIGSGDDINARATVRAVQGSHAWTKVGLMLRHDAVPASPPHFVLDSRSNGVAYQRRLTHAGPSLHTSISASSALPVTFELMRSSRTITRRHSVPAAPDTSPATSGRSV